MLVFAAAKLELGDTLYYLLIFALLIFLVQKYAWGPVSEMMEQRRQKVITDLDQAASNRKKAETLANERAAALKDSRQEAAKILSQAKSNAEKTKNDIINQADTEASNIREQAAQDAKQQKADAIREARNQVADLSVAIAEKIISKNLSATDQKELVDSFIKGIDD